MTAIIKILQEEHRNIEKILNVLEKELGVFDRLERPDYEILLLAVEYFQDHPARCHHPKEDVVYRALVARDPAVGEAVGDIEAEHRELANRLHRFAGIVNSILIEQEVPRETFDNAVRDFVAFERQHMEREERILFPAALKTLQPEDRVAIDARLTCGKDLLFNPTVEEKFHALWEWIVRCEEESEAARRQPAPA